MVLRNLLIMESFVFRVFRADRDKPEDIRVFGIPDGKVVWTVAAVFLV
jgi:hypothetical protein